MKHKTFTGGIKAANDDTGQVVAIFSRFNVRDHDGDVTLPGAFEEGAQVRVSAYNHSSWQSALPVGRGTISTDGEVALADMQFFLKTAHGRDTFETVKELGELTEWSYGYDVLESSHGQLEGEDVQFLKALKVHEVSPVLLGAGIGTGTLSVKSLLKDKTDDQLCEEAVELIHALKERGIVPPVEVAEYVRQADADAETKRRGHDTLQLIAAAHGIDINKGA